MYINAIIKKISELLVTESNRSDQQYINSTIVASIATQSVALCYSKQATQLRKSLLQDCYKTVIFS